MASMPIILLKDGTESKQGKSQIINNINACCAIADCVRTTLGPRGMDKLVVDRKGKTTISNDGATVLKLLDIVYPAALVMSDIAKSQDAEVGDGTTSVVVLAAELLKQAKAYVEDGVNPQLIIRSYNSAAQEAVKKLHELAVKITGDAQFRDMLIKCAETTLSSKLVRSLHTFQHYVRFSCLAKAGPHLLRGDGGRRSELPRREPSDQHDRHQEGQRRLASGIEARQGHHFQEGLQLCRLRDAAEALQEPDHRHPQHRARAEGGKGQRRDADLQ
ncbi:T-complex protein 1, partial [Aphelenchoides avenae]